MSVEFNEGSVPTVRRAPGKGYSFPTRWILALHLAKTPQGAAVILTVIALAALIGGGVLAVRSFSGPPAATPEQLMFEQN